MFERDVVCLSPAHTRPNKDSSCALIWGLRLVAQPNDIFCRVPFRQNHCRPRSRSPYRLLSRSPTLVPSSESSAEPCRFVPLRTRGRSKVKTAILHPSFDMTCVVWGKPRVSRGQLSLNLLIVCTGRSDGLSFWGNLMAFPVSYKC